MQTTNPFALRLDLISIAKDLLMTEYHVERERILEEWRLKVELARESGNKSDIPEMPAFPPYPSESEILKKANVLNDFVSKSK